MRRRPLPRSSRLPSRNAAIRARAPAPHPSPPERDSGGGAARATRGRRGAHSLLVQQEEQFVAGEAFEGGVHGAGARAPPARRNPASRKETQRPREFLLEVETRSFTSVSSRVVSRTAAASPTAAATSTVPPRRPRSCPTTGHDRFERDVIAHNQGAAVDRTAEFVRADRDHVDRLRSPPRDPATAPRRRRRCGLPSRRASCARRN
jgi:hypothetical protein